MLILNSESGKASVMALGLTALLILGGCDSGGDEQPAGGGCAGGTAAGGGGKTAGTEAKTAPSPEAPAATAGPVVQVDPATAGTITGTVTFSGNPPPKPPPIQFGAD